MKKDPKNIEIVTGNGKELDISPVYEHIATDKPKSTNKSTKKIVVPNQSKNKNRH